MKAAERRQPHPPRFAAVTYMTGRRLRLPRQIPSAPPQITTPMDTAVLENRPIWYVIDSANDQLPHMPMSGRSKGFTWGGSDIQIIRMKFS